MCKFIILLIAFGFGVASAATFVNQTSYIDDIRLSYENGIWQCDMIKCPLGIHGCRITRRNIDGNTARLLRTNICFHANGANVTTVFTTEDIPAKKRVEIDVKSYVDCESVYGTGYGIDLIGGWTGQNVYGVIAPKDWADAQQTTRDTIKEVEDKANGSGPSRQNSGIVESKRHVG